MGWWNTNSGSVIGLAGSLIGGLFGQSGQRDANKMNLALQQRQQQYETIMSNTAVRRRAEDIKAAGGNPALAFTSGQEATTPSVQPAIMQNENSQAAEMIGNIGPKMIQAKLAAQSMKASDADIQLTKAQASESRARAWLTLNTGRKQDEEIQNLAQTRNNLTAELAGILTKNRIAEIDERMKNATFEDQRHLITAQLRAANAELPNKESKAQLVQKAKAWIEDQGGDTRKDNPLVQGVQDFIDFLQYGFEGPTGKDYFPNPKKKMHSKGTMR